MQSVTDGSVVITALTGLTTLGCLSFPPDQVMVVEVTDMMCAGRHQTHSKLLEALYYLLRKKDIQPENPRFLLDINVPGLI